MPRKPAWHLRAACEVQTLDAAIEESVAGDTSECSLNSEIAPHLVAKFELLRGSFPNAPPRIVRATLEVAVGDVDVAKQVGC